MLRWIIGLIVEAIRRYMAGRKAPTPVPPSKPTPVPPQLPKQTDFAGRIVAAMNKLGYRVDEGSDRYNIIYIKNVDKNGKKRPDRGRYKYDDLRVVLQVIDGRARIIYAVDATVDPFISVNPGGAAQIACPSQQTAWQTGWHKGKEWGLLQTGAAVTIDRDTNKNFVRDSGDTRMTGWYGINHHSGTSAGCLTVLHPEDQRDFMLLIQRDARYQANKRFIFTTTILPAEAVQ